MNLIGYDDTNPDMYLPIFSMLEFVFYFGWLKVSRFLQIIAAFSIFREKVVQSYLFNNKYLSMVYTCPGLHCGHTVILYVVSI